MVFSCFSGADVHDARAHGVSDDYGRDVLHGDHDHGAVPYGCGCDYSIDPLWLGRSLSLD